MIKKIFCCLMLISLFLTTKVYGQEVITPWHNQDNTEIYLGSQIVEDVYTKNLNNFRLSSVDLLAQKYLPYQEIKPDKEYLISQEISFEDLQQNQSQLNEQCGDEDSLRYCLCSQFERVSKGKKFDKISKKNIIKFDAKNKNYYCQKKRAVSYKCYLVKDINANFVSIFYQNKKYLLEFCEDPLDKESVEFVDSKQICQGKKRIFDGKNFVINCQE